jgi:hypothetical protein
MIWAIPLALCLCAAAVHALRRNWKNALVWLLASLLFLQWMAFSGQIHTLRVTQVPLRTRVLRLEKEVEILKEWMKIEIEDKSPNQPSQPIAGKPGSG